MAMMWRPLMILAALTLTPLTSWAEDSVKVTVLAILANSEDDKVCPKCAPIAVYVQKRDPSLTSFHIERTTVKDVPVGQSVKFPLVDKVEVIVTVESKISEDGKISLTVEPPTLGAVTYNCVCGKCFPILTRHKTPQGDRLIVAVMADSCPKKKE